MAGQDEILLHLALSAVVSEEEGACPCILLCLCPEAPELAAMWDDLLSEPQEVCEPTSSSCPHTPPEPVPADCVIEPPTKRTRVDEVSSATSGPGTWTTRMLSTQTLQDLAMRMKRPVRVHTACSGTGAPVWALKVRALLA